MPPMTRRRRWYDLGVIGLKTIANAGWGSVRLKFRQDNKKIVWLRRTLKQPTENIEKQPPQSIKDSVELIKFKNMDDFQRLTQSVIEKRMHAERLIADENKNKKKWYLNGFCEVCEMETRLLVDWNHSYGNAPNYRERMVCRFCGLNNRQRFMVSFLKRLISCDKVKDVYLYEQVTGFYRYIRENLSVNVVGSEYLGFGQKPGTIIKGIRHEDALNLSLEDNSLDMIVSNDVYEHVPDIEKSFGEAYRVLKVGGNLVFTIPFSIDKYRTERRAELAENGKVVNLLPEIYHGNPMDRKGSLVFYDFGWDILDLCKKAGFRDAYALGYYSVSRGYMGNGLQLMFVAEK